MNSDDGFEKPLSLASNDFEFFDLPSCFKLDSVLLDDRWKNLQRKTHPDNFSMQDMAAQRIAMQYSVRINEAYQRLKDPLKRAAYLCELNGSSIKAEENTQMPPDFLMQQMLWREQLEDAPAYSDIEKLHTELKIAKKLALKRCETFLDDDQDWPKAANEVRILMFMERFEQDIDKRRDQLENA